MTDDNTDVTDTMWDQYATALLWEAVGDDFDAATQAFSVSSILLFVGVAAVDPAIANYAVFRLGNLACIAAPNAEETNFCSWRGR